MWVLPDLLPGHTSIFRITSYNVCYTKLLRIKVKPRSRPNRNAKKSELDWYKQEEFNPMVEKAYILSGKAYFYKGQFMEAIGVFNYVTRHFITSDVRFDALIWMGRCYSELGWYYEADDILKKANDEKLPYKYLREYNAAVANVITSYSIHYTKLYDKDTQNGYSTLVDGYKKTELVENTGLALFRMESILVDKAEPSESLRANTVWQYGLNNPYYLLSCTQLDAVRTGEKPMAEPESKGVRGALFACADLAVITSYSIHYTKLYDKLFRFLYSPIHIRRGDAKLIVVAISIHLYNFGIVVLHSIFHRLV